MTWVISCISYQFSQIPRTDIWVIQILVSIVLWLAGIVVAVWVFRRQFDIALKQIEISKEQQELWERQFEVDVIRYAIDTRIINKNELITIIQNCNNELKRTDLTQDDIELLKSKRAEADNTIPELSNEIKELINKYHRILNKHPNKFILEE